MSEFSVEYDRDEGTLRVTTDLETRFLLIPAIQDSMATLRDLSRIFIGLLRGLAELPRAFLKTPEAE